MDVEEKTVTFRVKLQGQGEQSVTVSVSDVATSQEQPP